MTLEKIVRPYVAPSVFSGTVVPPASPKQPTRALLSWTGDMPGDFQTFQPGPFYYPSTKQTQDDSDKKQTKKEKVRVENPDDSSQYVVVERVKSMTMTDQTGKKLSMDFSGLWDSPSGGGTFNEGGSSKGSGAESGPGSGKSPPPPPTIDLGPPDGAPPGWSASHPDQPWVGEDATPPPDTPGTPLPASFRVTSVTKEIVTFPFPLAAEVGGGDDSIPIENQGADDGTLPKYGTDANPVKFDPFRTIRSVGWGGGVYALFRLTNNIVYNDESGWVWIDGTILKTNPLAAFTMHFKGAQVVFAKPVDAFNSGPVSTQYAGTFLIRVSSFGKSGTPGHAADTVASVAFSGSIGSVTVREYIGIHGFGWAGGNFHYVPSPLTSEFMSYPGNMTNNLQLSTRTDTEDANIYIKSTGGLPNSTPNSVYNVQPTGLHYGDPLPSWLTDASFIELWHDFGFEVTLYPAQGHVVYKNDVEKPIRLKDKNGNLIDPIPIFWIDSSSTDGGLDFAIVREPYVKNNTKDLLAKTYPIQTPMLKSFPDNGALKPQGYRWEGFRKKPSGRVIDPSGYSDKDFNHIPGGPPPLLDSVPPDTAPP